MSIYQHYLQSAVSLIDRYDKKVPFHLYLKQFFSLHKKYGSRDRKLVSAFCFYFLRLGHAFRDMPTPDRILLAWYLLHDLPGPMLAFLKEDFNKHIHLSLNEKLEVIGVNMRKEDIFPFYYLFSFGVNGDDYCSSILRQPDLFLRIRPGYLPVFKKKMRETGWDYILENESAVRLANSQQVEKHFKLNREIVIQDLNSQEVGNVIKRVFGDHHFTPSEVWDCCAASGGKSIMLADLFPGIQLTVSDIRNSILQNLDNRFKEAGIKAKKSFIADLSVPISGKTYGSFPLIIADVPCTGSGTWARTPEQLYYFDESIIESYSQRQKAIVRQLIKSLRPGGWLIYVTCSVFKMENEEVVEVLNKECGLELIQISLLDGTRKAADSMFIAILKKPNA